MPTLVFDTDGKRRGGLVDGRILIGRKTHEGVVIRDPAVSRLHAWIENQDGAFVIRDAGSRTGTFVNGEAVVRAELDDGDSITIGPTTMEFRAGGDLPEGVTLVPLSGDLSAVRATTSGILFSCTCGAPIYVGTNLSGRKGLCQYCGEPIRVPRIKRLVAGQVPKKPPASPAQPGLLAVRVTCGACHSLVDEAEPSTTCPDCGTSFHTDCWQENYGCSTYGCPQVNVLAPPEPVETAAEASTENSEPAPVEVDTRPVLLLAGSVLASVLGCLLFGIPALVVAGLSVRLLLRKGTSRKLLLILAAVLALAGWAGGVLLSRFWWMR